MIRPTLYGSRSITSNRFYEFKDKIFHVHYKDIKVYPEKLADVGVMATPLEYMSPKLPGLGDVDWGRYVSALTDIGYDGYTCIEVEDKAFEKSLDDAKESDQIKYKISEEFCALKQGKAVKQEQRHKRFQGGVQTALPVTGGEAMEDIRIGIIGHGFMGHEHEKMLTKMDGIRLVGFSDRDPSQLEDVQEGLKRYSSNEELINDPEVQVVLIAANTTSIMTL